MMKRYIMIIVAVFLIILDIRIPTMAYPAFETFKTEAPETLELIIHHVIGDNLRVDLFSDVAGYILIAVSAMQLLTENERFRKTILWSAVALGMYVFQNMMPFLLNGNERFRVGYLIYFVGAFLEAAVVLKGVFPICAKLNCVENRSYNNATIIILLISVGTGFVSKALWFFDLTLLSVIYLLVQIVTMGICWYRIFQNKKLLLGQ